MLAAGLVALSLTWWALGRGLGVDSAIYRSGVLALLHGQSLYQPLAEEPNWAPALPFAYPPVTALLFAPLVLVPSQLACGLIVALSVLASGAVIRVCLAGSGLRMAEPVTLLAVLALEPVWRTLALGQLNLVLMAWSCWTCWCSRDPGGRGCSPGWPRRSS